MLSVGTHTLGISSWRYCYGMEAVDDLDAPSRDLVSNFCNESQIESVTQ